MGSAEGVNTGRYSGVKVKKAFRIRLVGSLVSEGSGISRSLLSFWLGNFEPFLKVRTNKMTFTCNLILTLQP